MKNRVLSAALLAVLACTSCATKSPESSEAESPAGKMVIYQMMVRVFGNDNVSHIYNGTREENGCGRMSDITPEALQSIRRLGCNYVWYTGILQQATKTDWSQYGLPRQTAAVVKGNAGSPYAISDYYGVSADLADDVTKRAEEFDALLSRTHEAGLKVILDFVPNHVAREYHSICCPEGVEDLGAGDKQDVAFDLQNNFYYFPGQTLNWKEAATESDGPNGGQIANGSTYAETPAKVSGNDVFGSVTPSVYDWYETVKLNYGVEYLADGSRRKAWENADGTITIPSTWVKMSDILLYWASKGVDAFRCDMSEMVPVEFWHYGIARVKEQYPDILFIAEIYNPRVYEDYICEGGFDYLYDKVELYDSIRSVVEGRRPIEAIESCLTLPTYSNDKVASHMLNFLENHDEQRVASDFFGKTPQAGIPALYVSALINGNPYMNYFAGELGEPSMDAEGFQGADGRTTIFDYWGLERQRAWKQAGWDEQQLPEEYLSVRRQYEKVLSLAQREAVVNGSTTNITDAAMREAGVFAFVRQTEADRLTVLANFSDTPYTATIDGQQVTVQPHDGMAL